MAGLRKVPVESPTDIVAAVHELTGGAETVPLISSEYLDPLPLGGRARDVSGAPALGDIGDAETVEPIDPRKLRANMSMSRREIAVHDAHVRRTANQMAGLPDDTPILDSGRAESEGYGSDEDEPDSGRVELPAQYIDLATGDAVWEGTPLTLTKAELASVIRIMALATRRVIADEINSLTSLSRKLSKFSNLRVPQRKRRKVQKTRRPRKSEPVPAPPTGEPTPTATTTPAPKRTRKPRVPKVPEPSSPA